MQIYWLLWQGKAEQWLVPILIFGHAKWTQHVTLQHSMLPCTIIHQPLRATHTLKSRLQEKLETMTSNPNTKQHMMSAEEEKTAR